MAGRRITVKSNQRQDINFTILVPPSSSADYRKHILNASNAKLRTRKISRIFLPGGQELTTPESVTAVLKTGLTLLVSEGEEYIGSCTPVEPPEYEVYLAATDIEIDVLAIAQLRMAAKLPGIIRAVGLPDLHAGGKFPIGATFVSEGYIHPALIGGDIGCGMSLFKTTLRPEKLGDQKGIKKVADSLWGLEGEWMSAPERGFWLGDDQAGLEWDKAVGTVGAGNHFAEIQIVEDVEAGYGINVGEVVLLVHSGSRGFGKHILERFNKHDESITIHDSHPDAQEYLRLHNKACGWARKSRQLIALRILQCIEQDWELPDDFNTDTIKPLRDQLEERSILDIHHNNVTSALWPPSPTGGPQKNVYIHRKGAAPAIPPTPLLPRPLIPLAGSRGTPTLLLEPVFSESTQHGAYNALSLAHGAGRAMSRNNAHKLSSKYNDDVKVLTEMKPLDRKYGGKGEIMTSGYVICDDRKLVWEEAVEAYKDVEAVGKAMEKDGVARIVGKCVPKVTYKLRYE